MSESENATRSENNDHTVEVPRFILDDLESGRKDRIIAFVQDAGEIFSKMRGVLRKVQLALREAYHVENFDYKERIIIDSHNLISETFPEFDDFTQPTEEEIDEIIKQLIEEGFLKDLGDGWVKLNESGVDYGRRILNENNEARDFWRRLNVSYGLQPNVGLPNLSEKTGEIDNGKETDNE